jgi:REP element-mobilizing transposase RayT
MKGEPILLTQEQAPILLAQFQETAEYRGWALLAVAVLRNHAHLIVGVTGDPDPSYLLQSFKEYASRALNRRYPRPVNGTWWTESGSKRKLPDAQAVAAAVAYVKQQAYPLLIWSPDQTALASGGRQSPGDDTASGGRQSPGDDTASGGRQSPGTTSPGD